MSTSAPLKNLRKGFLHEFSDVREKLMSSLKDKTVKGVIWSAVDRFSAQGIQFVFSLISSCYIFIFLFLACYGKQRSSKR